MTSNNRGEKAFGVWLGSDRVGVLVQTGDYTQFSFLLDYVDDPNRSILGLAFEPNLRKSHTSALRLPPWFSNLLPEGRLRDWIASDRGVSAEREMELLAQVGQDLPGAVRVLPDTESPQSSLWERVSAQPGPTPDSRRSQEWKFSLAGVGMKFSMIQRGDRLTIPASGLGGDWIVKLPDPEYEQVPLNEFAMMQLAELAGIEVPTRMLVHRDELGPIPENAWQSSEHFAYAISRFDRPAGGELMHIEDFAQVKNIYPYNNAKYEGNFETVASLAYRQFDSESLLEFVRRHTLNILISNGDAHLKNWSLIYRDSRRPTLSPAYDIVSTQIYNPGIETSALKFGSTKRFDQMRLYDFERLGVRLNAESLDLAGIARQAVDRVNGAWEQVASELNKFPALRTSVGESIQRRTRSLLSGAN